MQKYTTYDDLHATGPDGAYCGILAEERDVYLASDVDAKFKEYDDDNLVLSQAVVKLGARIAELEQQLAGANASIALFMGPDGEQHINRFATAARSLMESVT